MSDDLKETTKDTRPFWRKKRWWVILLVLASPYLAAGSVKLYRNYLFEKNKPEIIASLERLVMTDFSNQDDPSKPIPGVGRPWTSFIRCEDKKFLNPYEEWSGLKRHDEKAFLNAKLLKLGSVDALAQWFACQGIKTKFIKPSITLSVAYSRVYNGRRIKKPLWPRGSILFNWIPYADFMEIRIVDNRVDSIEFHYTSL